MKCSNCGVELRLNDRFCSQCGQPVKTPADAPVQAAGQAGSEGQGAGVSRVFRGHEGRVCAVAYAPDGLTAVSGGDDRTVRLWDVAGGRAIARWQGHEAAVTAVAFAPDGRRVASGSSDGSLRLWDVETGATAQVLAGHTWVVTGLSFSPDGTRVLSCSWDKTVRLWDAASGEELARLAGHEGYVTGAAFFPDGEYAFSCSHDGTLRAWDLVLRRGAGCLRSEQPSMFACMALSPGGKRAVVGTYEACLRLFDTDSARELGQLRGYQGQVSSVAFAPDGRHILTCGGTDYLGNELEPVIDNTVRLWDGVTGACVERFEGHEASVLAVACAPDGRHALSAGSDATLREWKLH